MVGTSKVLTVSYGTFSCTLEGFEDSFETMKAIAEYFRDLAANDRFFGAEPPTPDAEMLARIAEREIARRVEAHQTDGQIVLRAAEPAAAAAPAAEAAPRAESMPEPAAKAEPQAAPEPTVEPEAEVEAVPEAEAEDSVAARLRRIRSVVARSGIAKAEDYSEDEHAQDFLSRTAAELTATLAAEDEQDEALAGLAVRLREEQQAAAAPETAPEAALETAVAGQPAESHPPEEQDEQPATTAPAGEEDGDTLAQILSDALPEEGALEELEESATAAQAGEESPLVSDSGTATEVEAEPRRPLRARVVKMKRSEFEAAIAAGEIEEEVEEDFDLTAEIDETDETEGEEEAILSPEDEAELLRELAAVEAELKRAAQPEPEPLPEAPPARPAAEVEAGTPAAQRARRLQSAGTDPEAKRIFEEADTRFEAPDTSQRRSAIKHLRAAVAATRAEESAGGKLAPEADDTAYRSDLAQVVRPRRPRAPTSEGPERATRRPAEERPAPLKLVAEQRVDMPRSPVRPRRVSAAQPAAEAPATAGESGRHGSFAEYAEEIGATTLAELLEAAAAYMADVEGREKFSRPMLMGKLKEATREEFSREDGLRSFGQLLRQGKLQKLKGGRFTVTEHTEFRAWARRAG